jgi:hypothetical protein
LKRKEVEVHAALRIYFTQTKSIHAPLDERLKTYHQLEREADG